MVNQAKTNEENVEKDGTLTFHRFEDIQKQFSEVCRLEKGPSSQSLIIAEKVIYEQKETGDVYKKLYHPTAETMWEEEKIETLDFKEIERVAKELTAVQAYDVSEDKAFSYDTLIPLLSDDLTEKEKFAYIQLKQDEIICDWAFEEQKGQPFINEYKEDLYANLKSKVIDGHTYYQIGEEMELMISGVPDPHNEYTATTFNESGPLTDYSFRAAEDVTDFLTERHAIPCNKEAMTHVLGFLMPDMGQESSVKTQQHLIKDNVMRQTFEAKKGHPMTRV